VADKRRIFKAGALGRAEIAMPLGRISALWISTWSLVFCHIVCEANVPVVSISNLTIDCQVVYENERNSFLDP
jgi:hypothetical protein